MLLILFTVLVTTATICLYKRLIAPETDFWSKYGIRQIDISNALGPLDKLLGRKPMTDVDDYAYAKLTTSEKFCGILENGVPLLLVKDLDLVKKILIKDFDHFVDRRPFFSNEDGLLKLMLPNLEGEQWKGVRSAVSPAFSSGKIRRMMDIFNSIGAEWAKHLLPKSNSNYVIIDVLKSVKDYNIDVISSAVFGMKAEAIKNPHSTFCKMAHRATNFPSILSLIKFALKLMFPGFCRLFKISGVDKTSLAYFQRILRQRLELRINGEANNRNDLLQTLADAKQKQDQNSAIQQPWLTDEVLNAQCIVFFFGGFGTTSHLITFMLYALALNPDIQDKLRTDFKKVVKDDGYFDYNDISELNYLDMVLCESLRKFPVGGGRIERLCVREYQIPEMGLFVPKGTIIDIPVNAIHHSKEYYQNPDTFDPEHFSAENKAARNPYAFLPFGLGPRQCIGLRFTQIQVKSAIAYIVHNFNIEPTPKTPLTLQGAPVAFGLAPPKNLELKLTPITNTT